jgi:hypothetical protein
MSRKLLLVVALIAALSLVAAPVSAGADKPISGVMELDLLLGPCVAEGLPGFITWVGTVDIDGTTYGWADFPLGPMVLEGNFSYFEEYWTIFTLNPGEDPDLANACDPERVVLAGYDDGWVTPGGAGKANGTVDSVDSNGPFADVAIGSTMFWRGTVTNFRDGFDEFKAILHILPVK